MSDMTQEYHCPNCGKFVALEGDQTFYMKERPDDDYVRAFCDEQCADTRAAKLELVP